MTKEDLAKVLPEPFNFFALNGSIDYRCKGGRDHDYIRKLGYEAHMGSDCGMRCKDIPWFEFSSYGDWGTMFDDTTDLGRQIFYDMWRSGIITLWRGRTYTLDGRTIDYEDGKFTMCDENHKWVEINNPFETTNK